MYLFIVIRKYSLLYYIIFIFFLLNINAQESLIIYIKNRPSYDYNGLSIDNSTNNLPKFEFKKTEEELLGEPSHLFEPDVPNNDSENTVSGLPLLPYKGEGRILTDLKIIILMEDQKSIKIVGTTMVQDYIIQDKEFFVDSIGDSKFSAIYLLSNDHISIEEHDTVDENIIENTINYQSRAIPLISEKKDGVIYLTFPAVTREYTEYKKLHSALHVFYCCTEYQKSEIIKSYVINSEKPSAKDVIYARKIGRLAAYDAVENKLSYGSDDDMSGLDSIYKHEMGHYLWSKSFNYPYDPEE